MNPSYHYLKLSMYQILRFTVFIFMVNVSAAESTVISPARVENPIKEKELSQVVLTHDAVRRLGIITVRVEKQALMRSRLFSGEITLPAFSANTNGNNQSIYTLLPSLAPAEWVRLAQSQIDADGQVEQAKVQMQAAQQTLKRVEQMQRDKVGTARAVDDAKVQVGIAQVALKTAKAQRELLGPALLDMNNRKAFWVRVPVYVDDLLNLNINAPARIGRLTGSSETTTRLARSVAAPPSANPAAATIDLFYEVNNTDGIFRPGQRVGVSIPLRSEEENLVVPWSAIAYDVNGGSWLYQALQPNVYQRRRIQVLRVIEDQAAVMGNVSVGMAVVRSGVAELFGIEFGVGK